MNENVEKVLEQRIAELEKKLFGLEEKVNMDSVPESSVIDSLSHANTLISSALSGRDKINTLIQRLPEIESYIESDFEPTEVQTDVKLEYIEAMQAEIKENAIKLIKLKELAPVLESDSFKNLPELSEKLHNLSLKYIELGKRAEIVNSDTRNMISRYNDIITNISKTLIDMDAKVTALEKAVEPKKAID
ncbi:uncharacterized protein LOC131671040 [Phymastichus coffea]|uniref:uncharacterized protein LOC131671040 n=1 Tax=Phymastichus coffea TaxID=108790 RepID=UPI00273C57ED|nr:uncharacterized protein LOC131671040 [Phymastichus coffea]